MSTFGPKETASNEYKIENPLGKFRMPIDQSQHRVLVVGGGVAGLEVATALGRRWRSQGLRNPAACSITLVDSDSAHVWKPMLHTIAAGTRDISQQQTTFIAHARDVGFFYQPGELCGLDRGTREIVLGPLLGEDGRLLVAERRLGYDSLILAVGSRANDFGTPGVEAHCFTIDSRQQAKSFNNEVRIQILQSIASHQDLSIAIVGGGATGVELAAELIQLVDLSVIYGATELKRRVTITLIESGPRLLAAFPENISIATQTRLESLGVRVLTGARVSEASAHGFVLESGEKVPSSLRVWAAGVKGPGVLANMDGLETNRSDQVKILPSLRTTSDSNIFAIGDCSTLSLPGSARALPPTAQVAHQQAQHLIRHLEGAILRGEEIPAFTYRDFGSLVSLSEYDAFGSLGKFGFFKATTIRGRLAQLSHMMLYRSHQARLHGVWKGSFLWLVDQLNNRLRARIRLD